MPPATLFCPKCGHPLAVPQPAPDKMTCGQCRAAIRIAVPAKVGAAAKAAPQRPADPAPTTAHTPAGPGGSLAGLRIQDELASGGLGVVYLAYHLHLKDFRAVKRPRTDVGLDRDVLLARFRREVEALGGLYSPHVVRAFDAGADADGPYLVMEYLDGAPLSRLAEQRRQLPVAEACELVRQAALGLQAAHERGLVHRDVKPSNLMLARDGGGSARVVVIDWGLVKRAGDSALSGLAPAPTLTGLGTTMGTADYMAPEQVSDARSADTRADVYSLGATLYCLLAGKPPFGDKPDLEKLMAHQRERFPPLDRLRRDVPRELTAVLARMAEKDPARRYAAPGDAAAALQPFCRGATGVQLLNLLNPSPGQPAAVVPETQGIFQQKTVLGGAPYNPAGYAPPPNRDAPAVWAPQPAPAPRRRRTGVLLAVALGLLLVVGAAAVSVWALSGGATDKGKDANAKGDAKETQKTDSKSPPNADSPQVFIDEDFSKAFANRQTLPDGWSGDAFRVVKEHDEPCLEVSKPTGNYFVKAPPAALAGDFSVEAACVVDYGRPFVVRLESRKTNALLPITVDYLGQVAIADDVRLPPRNFKPYSPMRFLVKRQGKTLHVFLNDEVVADKTLDAVTEYELLQLGLGGGAFQIPGGSKVFRLKVATLP